LELAPEKFWTGRSERLDPRIFTDLSVIDLYVIFYILAKNECVLKLYTFHDFDTRQLDLGCSTGGLTVQIKMRNSFRMYSRFYDGEEPRTND